MNLHQYLTANLETLAARKEPVASWLAHAVKDIEGALARIFVNSMGILDWRMDDGTGLIEKCPPLPVLYDEWRTVKQPERDATVIVGVNLGYGLNHVLTGTPDSHKVIVIEPRADMLLACLGQTDYRPYLEAGKLRFIVPDHDQVENAVQRLDLNLVYGSIHLRNDLVCQQIGPEYAQLSQLTRGKLENFSVELATLRLKQEVMVGNELKNYADAMNNGSLQPLKDMAQGATAVILGAGPSLADTGPILAERPGHALYACALQTLPALERVGLKPDMCLAIDFRPEMMQLYDNIQDMSWLEDLPLIYSTKLDPDVVKRYPGPKIPLWTMGGIGTYVFHEHELVLDAGGNVGVTLARFLSWCGVSRIVLAGQDFSWPADRTHAPGHHAHQNVQSFDPQRDVELKNLWGKTIYSNVGYLSAMRDLEKDLRKAPGPGVQHLRRRRGDPGQPGGGCGGVPSEGAAHLAARSQGTFPGRHPQGQPAPHAPGLPGQVQQLEFIASKRDPPSGKVPEKAREAPGRDQESAEQGSALPQAGPAVPALPVQRGHGHGGHGELPGQVRAHGHEGVQGYLEALAREGERDRPSAWARRDTEEGSSGLTAGLRRSRNASFFQKTRAEWRGLFYCAWRARSQAAKIS